MPGGCTLLPEKRQSQSNLFRQHDVLFCGYIKGYLEFAQLRMNTRTKFKYVDKVRGEFRIN